MTRRKSQAQPLGPSAGHRLAACSLALVLTLSSSCLGPARAGSSALFGDSARDICLCGAMTGSDFG